MPVFKFPRWRLKGKAITEVVDQYKAVGAELNVLPFCSQFIPMEVIDHPTHGSVIYHPSLLPRHRGASAINWYVCVYVFFLCFITEYVYVCSFWVLLVSVCICVVIRNIRNIIQRL